MEQEPVRLLEELTPKARPTQQLVDKDWNASFVSLTGSMQMLVNYQRPPTRLRVPLLRLWCPDEPFAVTPEPGPPRTPWLRLKVPLISIISGKPLRLSRGFCVDSGIDCIKQPDQ